MSPEEAADALVERIAAIDEDAFVVPVWTEQYSRSKWDFRRNPDAYAVAVRERVLRCVAEINLPSGGVTVSPVQRLRRAVQVDGVWTNEAPVTVVTVGLTWPGARPRVVVFIAEA